MCTTVAVEKGEVIRLFTGTGGGFGKPSLRPDEKIAADIKNGYVTAAQAQRDYNYVPQT